MLCFPLYILQITEEHKARVIQYERDLLIATSFQFNLTHPHELILKISKSIGLSKETAQKAWELTANWYQNEDFVLWEPPHGLALSALNSVLKPTEAGLLKEFAHKNSLKIKTV